MLSHIFGGTGASHFIEEKMESNAPAAAADLGGCQLPMRAAAVMMGLVLQFSGR